MENKTLNTNASKSCIPNFKQDASLQTVIARSNQRHVYMTKSPTRNITYRNTAEAIKCSLEGTIKNNDTSHNLMYIKPGHTCEKISPDPTSLNYCEPQDKKNCFDVSYNKPDPTTDRIALDPTFLECSPSLIEKIYLSSPQVMYKKTHSTHNKIAPDGKLLNDNALHVEISNVILHNVIYDKTDPTSGKITQGAVSTNCSVDQNENENLTSHNIVYSKHNPIPEHVEPTAILLDNRVPQSNESNTTFKNVVCYKTDLTSVNYSVKPNVNEKDNKNNPVTQSLPIVRKSRNALINALIKNQENNTQIEKYANVKKTLEDAPMDQHNKPPTFRSEINNNSTFHRRKSRLNQPPNSNTSKVFDSYTYFMDESNFAFIPVTDLKK